MDGPVAIHTAPAFGDTPIIVQEFQFPVAGREPKCHIGNADPRGLTIAVAAMQAVEFVGMPEARINLAQATTYLASAPKSNAAYLALDEAAADVRSGRVQPVPEHLKNVHVKAEGKAEAPAYKYPHDFADTAVAQDYLTVPKTYYRPKPTGYEETIAKRLAWLKAKKAES